MSFAAGLEQRMGTDTQLWGLGDTECPRKGQDGSWLQVPGIALGYKGLSPCFMAGFATPGGISVLGYSFSLLEPKTICTGSTSGQEERGTHSTHDRHQSAGTR